MRINLSFFPEWKQLLASTFTPDTTIAPDDVQDDDPTPYRHDRRISYVPFPSQHQRTHYAILALESDDEGYSLFFTLEELPDHELEQSVEVYRLEIATLAEQKFKFDSGEILPVNRSHRVDVRITVSLTEYVTDTR